MSNHNFKKIILEFEKKFSKGNLILSSDDSMKEYLSSCILVERSVVCAVKAKNRSDVEFVVKVCNKFKVPLYPISTGKNWGYGSSNPAVNGCVILDLSLMNKIIEYDSVLGVVRIEPGVTQQQLYEFLESSEGNKFKMDPTGSSPQCSVLANSLERGFGIGLMNNHFESLSNLEVVLPSGVVINTGFGHYKNCKSSDVYRYGVGPYFDGLFSQSNLGVVTCASVALSPKFEELNLVLMKFEDESKFEKVLDILQNLRIIEVIRSPINVLCRNRVLSVKTKFPFDLTSKSMMGDVVSRQLGVKNTVASWNVTTSIFGTSAQVAAAKKQIKKELACVDEKVFFFSEKNIDNLKMYSFVTRPFVKLIAKVDINELYLVLKRAIGIFKGVPSNVSMKSPYWRSDVDYVESDDVNPARDNCGLYWISPVIPFRGFECRKAYDIGKKVCDKYGFDFAPTYTVGGARFIDNTIPLMYNKDDSEECARAYKCYRELIKSFKKNGFMIYRAGITCMDLVVDSDDTFWKFKNTLKKGIDENNIIAPGRYE
jgi:4-cresol dehydrogenase (hydroxylating)